MSEMSNTNVSNNDINKTGVYNEGLSPTRCPVVRTSQPGRQQATATQKVVNTKQYLCNDILLSKSARCERIKTEILCFLERKRVVSSRRAKVV